jgi:hypothetical protein
MKRIRLEVPDDWPGQFKRYAQALALVAARPAVPSTRDTLATFKLIGALDNPPWDVPSFRAWAAVRGWVDTMDIIESIEFPDQIRAFNQAAAAEAAKHETEL